MKEDSQEKQTQSEDQISLHQLNSLSMSGVEGPLHQEHSHSSPHEDSCSLTASDFEVLDFDHLMFPRSSKDDADLRRGKRGGKRKEGSKNGKESVSTVARA